jgi:programmed cell death 8 (apoptosis-inducing factor)
MRPPLSKDIWYTDDDDVIQKHSFKQWNGNEKRLFFNIKFLFHVEMTFLFSLYFLDEEFYADVKSLNDEENGGVGVVLGRKVRF